MMNYMWRIGPELRFISTYQHHRSGHYQSALIRSRRRPLSVGENANILRPLFRSLKSIHEEEILKEWRRLCPYIAPDNEVSFAVSIMGALLIDGTNAESAIEERFELMEKVNAHPALIRFLKRLTYLYWDMEMCKCKPDTNRWIYSTKLAWRVASEFQVRKDLRMDTLQQTNQTDHSKLQLIENLRADERLEQSWVSEQDINEIRGLRSEQQLDKK